MSIAKKTTLRSPLMETVGQLISEFDQIAAQRKAALIAVTQFVENKVSAGQKACLNFICTHNSRRSHLSQIWAQAAAHYYNIPDVVCFSGGTEATAFNPRAVKAMQEAGFSISKFADGKNPVYDVKFAGNAPSIRAFSKRYDDPFNHNVDFAAVMTCSHADENCPLVPGATARIALPYEDPKDFDDTPEEAAKYQESVHQIGREMLYAFSQVNVQ